jgi:DNA-binding NarL/FixJ family response regulator
MVNTLVMLSNIEENSSLINEFAASTMPKRKSPTFLRVCIVAENRLAGEYVRQILGRDSLLVNALDLKQYMRISPLQRSNTIFIVDHCGLELPLYECIRQLKTCCSNAKFLLLGHEKSTGEIVNLLALGVEGYLPHVDVPRKLIRAILSLADNQYWVPPAALHQFLCEAGSALRKDGTARNITTERENQVLELVRRRYSNREIANYLQIRVSTVKFHLSNILSKMHAHSRHELMEFPKTAVWKTLSA